MKLHTVVISYNRLDLLQETLSSYLATVTVPYSLMVVDNHSDSDVRAWLGAQLDYPVLLLRANLYPGAACNIGFEYAPDDATHLHRSDSDMRYLPGWDQEVQCRFVELRRCGQVGLRTDAEELECATNVGGTCVIDRQLWRAGVRWDTRPWEQLGSTTEDYYLSQEVQRRGWRWTRVRKPCVVHLASGDRDDPYYQHSYGIRGI